jgi:hypothetical protein
VFNFSSDRVRVQQLLLKKSLLSSAKSGIDGFARSIENYAANLSDSVFTYNKAAGNNTAPLYTSSGKLSFAIAALLDTCRSTLKQLTQIARADDDDDGDYDNDVDADTPLSASSSPTGGAGGQTRPTPPADDRDGGEVKISSGQLLQQRLCGLVAELALRRAAVIACARGVRRNSLRGHAQALMMFFGCF